MLNLNTSALFNWFSIFSSCAFNLSFSFCVDFNVEIKYKISVLISSISCLKFLISSIRFYFVEHNLIVNMQIFLTVLFAFSYCLIKKSGVFVSISKFSKPSNAVVISVEESCTLSSVVGEFYAVIP